MLEIPDSLNEHGTTNKRHSNASSGLEFAPKCRTLVEPGSDCLAIANIALKYVWTISESWIVDGDEGTTASSVIDSGSELRHDRGWREREMRRNGVGCAINWTERNWQRWSETWMEIREKRAWRSARLDSRTCPPRSDKIKTRELYTRRFLPWWLLHLPAREPTSFTLAEILYFLRKNCGFFAISNVPKILVFP